MKLCLDEFSKAISVVDTIGAHLFCSCEESENLLNKPNSFVEMSHLDLTYNRVICWPRKIRVRLCRIQGPCLLQSCRIQSAAKPHQTTAGIPHLMLQWFQVDYCTVDLRIINVQKNCFSSLWRVCTSLYCKLMDWAFSLLMVQARSTWVIKRGGEMRIHNLRYVQTKHY